MIDEKPSQLAEKQLKEEQLRAGEERYPVPTEPPVYASSPRRVSTRKSTPVWDAVAAVFVVVAMLLVMWLAVAILLQGKANSPKSIVYLVIFWVICAYLAIPRLHQIFSIIYAPDYFIGRTRTGDGVLGDPVNLAIDGKEEDIHAAMQAAGWTLADDITIRSTWKIVMSSLFRRSYPQAPVSHLYLFGRRQAFTYQREVGGSASQRHHVRLWPTPHGWRLPGGERVQWLGAGTYDRSVGLSRFTGQVTHKIDADIDAERDYIISTVRYADPEVKVRVIHQFSTSYHSRNGGGDKIQTDGDLPVLDVTGAATRSSYNVPLCDDSGIARHHIPPGALLFAGAFALGAFILALVEIIVNPEPDISMMVGPATQCALWLLTVMRMRWAWVGLMTTSCMTALAHLYLLDFSEPWNVAYTALVVYVVLVVSASSVRDWVRPRMFNADTASEMNTDIQDGAASRP